MMSWCPGLQAAWLDLDTSFWKMITDRRMTMTTLRLPNTVKVRADVDLMAKNTLRSVRKRG